MFKFISSIEGTIPRTTKNFSINADGKGIIITGMNGCGKTQLLKALHGTLMSSLSSTEIQRERSLYNTLKIQRSLLDKNSMTKVNQRETERRIERLKSDLESIKAKQKLLIKWHDREEVLNLVDKGGFLLNFFSATRQYVQATDNSSKSLEQIKDLGRKQGLEKDFSINFESYLVAFFEAGYLAWALRNEVTAKERVDSWLLAIEDDLKFLFEDESLTLSYEEKQKKFFINQKDKEPYKFNALSSGYSSILNVYTDLLMKVELKELSKKELVGIVIIDEIDAHLHVTLQRKILAFLKHSYPNVQFIVSTHSPFVLQSVDDAIIFDLSKMEQLEDLSMYSYSSIASGLLGVDSKSDELSNTMKELALLLSKDNSDKARIKEIISSFSKVEDKLDTQSRVLLLKAKEAINSMGG